MHHIVSPIHPFTHPPNHPIHPFTHWTIHPFTHSPHKPNSLTHSFTLSSCHSHCFHVILTFITHSPYHHFIHPIIMSFTRHCRSPHVSRRSICMTPKSFLRCLNWLNRAFCPASHSPVHTIHSCTPYTHSPIHQFSYPAIVFSRHLDYFHSYVIHTVCASFGLRSLMLML